MDKENTGCTDDSQQEFSHVVAKFAHEFNNLLVGIIGNGRLLADGGHTTASGRPLLNEILQCAERATELTERMLTHDYLTTAMNGSLCNSIEDHHPTLKELRVQGSQETLDTVLVIDDEEVVRSVSKAILARAGYNVLVAASGDEGIRIFEENRHRIVCVILDLTMPYMRGNLVFARLKACAPEVKVYIMSGYSDRQALEEFDSEGILGFIQKPFQTEDLVGAVRNCQEKIAQEQGPITQSAANIS